MKLSCFKLGVKLFCVGFLFVATSLLNTKIYCNSNIAQQSFFLEQFYFFTANQNLNNQHLISQQNKNLSISCKNIHVSLNEFCEDTVTVAALTC
jgi:hypothetical protein